MSSSRNTLVLSHLLLLLVACGEGVSTLPTTAVQTVTGTVREWKVQVAPASVVAGETTFSITNEGVIGHEFLVVKTDFADGKIPLPGNQLDEEMAGIDVVDQIDGLSPGKTSELTVTLESGTYQLVCNLPGHYKAGMHTTLIVTT